MIVAAIGPLRLVSTRNAVTPAYSSAVRTPTKPKRTMRTSSMGNSLAPGMARAAPASRRRAQCSRGRSGCVVTLGPVLPLAPGPSDAEIQAGDRHVQGKIRHVDGLEPGPQDVQDFRRGIDVLASGEP